MLRLSARMTRAWFTTVIFITVPGCGNPDSVPSASHLPDKTRANSGQAAPMLIAAASDLQLVLPQLAEQFRAKSSIATTITFGASGQLAEQIKQGAPFDIFLAANESFVRDLARGGFIKPESVASYARGSLVLAVYQGIGETVHSLNDLTRPAVKKIALANPATAPYGKAGKQALERAGIWNEIRPKIVLAESVRQALLYAQKGDADAALVGRAIANVPEIRPVEIEPRLYDPIVQALGVVSASARTADAEQFVRFVLGDDGQGILKTFGFAPAKTQRAPESPNPAQPQAKSGTPRL
jgi:molybdate transport system substrate-binding protein